MTDVQALAVAAAAFVVSFSGASVADIAAARASAVVGVITLAQSAAAPIALQRTEAAPGQPRYGIALSPPRGGEQSLPILEVSEIAEAAGVRAGDRIVSLNGTPVSQIPATEFGSYMRASPLVLVVDRSGETLTFEMALTG
jgi:hypothetical protein